MFPEGTSGYCDIITVYKEIKLWFKSLFLIIYLQANHQL